MINTKMKGNSLVLRKVNLGMLSNKGISCKIAEAFENSDSYFRSTIKGNRIVIGKALSQAKEESLKQKISLLSNHLPSKKNQSRNSLSTVETKMTLPRSVSLPMLKHIQSSTNSSVTIETKNHITDAELSHLFESYKLLTQKNSTKSNEFFTQGQPERFKQLLLLQEDTLRKRDKQKKFEMNIKRHMSNKINRPSDDLLLSRIASYRSIREIRDKTDDRSSLERETNGRWDFNLRYKDDYKGVKKGYVNIGSLNSPTWAVINNKTPKIEERVRCAFERESPEHKSFLGNPYLKKKEDYASIKKSYEDLQGLSITGKGLLQLELDQMKVIKGKKKIVKPTISDEATQPKEFIKNLSMRNLLSVKTINSCRNLHQ